MGQHAQTTYMQDLPRRGPSALGQEENVDKIGGTQDYRGKSWANGTKLWWVLVCNNSSFKWHTSRQVVVTFVAVTKYGGE